MPASRDAAGVVSQAEADVLQSKLEERVGGGLQQARPEEGDIFKKVRLSVSEAT